MNLAAGFKSVITIFVVQFGAARDTRVVVVHQYAMSRAFHVFVLAGFHRPEEQADNHDQ